MPSNNGDNKVQKIVDRKEMEANMMENFQEKFLEVYDTPIAHVPFINILGKIGLHKNVERFLDGTFTFPPVIHPDILEFSNHCKMDDNIRTQPPLPTNMCSFWRPG